MSIVEIKDLEMSYFEKVLYKNVNLEINEGDKVLLMGENGKGKSTLIKLITGEESPVKGTVKVADGVKISTLNQFVPIDDNITVKELLDRPFKRIIDLEHELLDLSEKMVLDESLMDLYIEKNEQFEALGGYDYITEQTKFIKAFDFDGLINRMFKTLSGGEKQYMLLAVALFDEGEFIILDEPVTFFDKKKSNWLINFINNSIKTFLIVAHDEAFSKKVPTKIFDIDNLEIVSYDTNYMNYLIEKKKYLEQKIEENADIDEKLELKRIAVAKKLKWMELTDDKYSHAVTVRRLTREIEKLESQKFVFEEETDYDYTLSPLENPNPTDIELIKFTNVSMEIDDKLLYKNVNFTFNKNDRIVITGENGAGKSTFLKLITGEKVVTSGDVFISPELEIGYISQDIFFEDENMTVFDYCKRVSRLGDIILEEYIDKLFENDIDFRIKRLYMLSGGESKRVQILANILQGINLLILDEPTTFMDTYSKKKLIELLKSVDVGIILVTHDIELIRAIAYNRFRIENNRFNKN